MSSGAVTFASTNAAVNTLCIASALPRITAVAALPEANVLASEVEWLFWVSGMRRGENEKKMQGEEEVAPTLPGKTYCVSPGLSPQSSC